MGRSDTQRYDQALAYVRALDIELANEIDKVGSLQKIVLGAGISLAKGGFWNTGTPTQHMALRGLLLCQSIYLKPPFLAVDATNAQQTKTYFKSRTEMQICDAIRSYARKKQVSLHDFAETARHVTTMTGTFDPLVRTRAEAGNWGGVTNCYGAVKVWLYASGLCSLQWSLKEGSKLDAYSCNRIIGDGKEVDDSQFDAIREGWVFNIQDSKDTAICHWGASLGNGFAAASNTTPAEMRFDGSIVQVHFNRGDTGYGIFKLQESVDVCRLEYTSKAVKVKITNPLLSTSYC